MEGVFVPTELSETPSSDAVGIQARSDDAGATLNILRARARTLIASLNRKATELASVPQAASMPLHDVKSDAQPAALECKVEQTSASVPETTRRPMAPPTAKIMPVVASSTLSPPAKLQSAVLKSPQPHRHARRNSTLAGIATDDPRLLLKALQSPSAAEVSLLEHEPVQLRSSRILQRWSKPDNWERGGTPTHDWCDNTDLVDLPRECVLSSWQLLQQYSNDACE